MTTNKGLDLAAVHDLSSFEPEAILAAAPGEHPRAAAALALGREASNTGYLDVAELSRIASELYAEGFPAGAFGGQAAGIPSTASLSDAREPVHAQSAPANAYTSPAPFTHRGWTDVSAAQLQYAPGLESQAPSSDVSGYPYQLNGVEIPSGTVNSVIGGV